MKLRMETGNFNIVLDEERKAYLPKGLSQEDLLGAVIVDNYGINPECFYFVLACCKQSESDALYIAYATFGLNDSATLAVATYDPVTGLFGEGDD